MSKLKSALAISFALLTSGVSIADQGNGNAPSSITYVTSGNVQTFSAGLQRGYVISGHATMVRTTSNKTIADLKVHGLVPDTSYGSHVHNAPCSTGGGGHYQDNVGGPVDAVNEIWLSFTTNAAGIGTGMAKNDFFARPEAQSIVVHDFDGKRIACADLK